MSCGRHRVLIPGGGFGGLYAAPRRPMLFTAGTVRGWLLNLPVEPGLPWTERGLVPRYPTIDAGLPASPADAVAFRWLDPAADRTRG